MGYSTQAQKAKYNPSWHIKDSPIYINRADGSELTMADLKSNITYQSHWHDFVELVFIRKEGGIHRIDNKHHECHRGQVYLILPGTHHSFDGSVPVALSNILFFPWRIKQILDSIGDISGLHNYFSSRLTRKDQKKAPPVLQLEGSEHPSIFSLLDRMQKESDGKEPGYKGMLEAHFLNLLISLSRSSLGRKNLFLERGTPSQKVGYLVHRLEQEFHLPWTLEEMAAAIHTSVPSLCRYFKEHTGSSPLDYLIRLRIEKAKDLISHSDLLITEIAFQVGFNDGNYFARQFKRICGISAGGYRKRQP